MFYLLIPAAIFGTDMYIKQKIEKEGREGEAKEILDGKLLLRKAHNKGAMLNFMDDHPDMVAGFSLGLALCVALGFFYSLGQKGKGMLKPVSYTHLDVYKRQGFPFEQTAMTIPSRNDCVVPNNLANNVSQLHQWMFGTEDYTPSDTVQEISNRIINETGVQ